jgi:hypothetical protein
METNVIDLLTTSIVIYISKSVHTSSVFEQQRAVLLVEATLHMRYTRIFIYKQTYIYLHTNKQTYMYVYIYIHICVRTSRVFEQQGAVLFVEATLYMGIKVLESCHICIYVYIHIYMYIYS